jgi:hypothetical protein
MKMRISRARGNVPDDSGHSKRDPLHNTIIHTPSQTLVLFHYLAQAFFWYAVLTPIAVSSSQMRFAHQEMRLVDGGQTGRDAKISRDASCQLLSCSAINSSSASQSHRSRQCATAYASRQLQLERERRYRGHQHR